MLSSTINRAAERWTRTGKDCDMTGTKTNFRVPSAALLALVTTAALAGSVTAHAGSEQPIRFEGYTQSEGLSQNSVLSIVQHSTGHMWFATENGLNRFDGYEFESFRHEALNPGSLTSDFIFVVEVARSVFDPPPRASITRSTAAVSAAARAAATWLSAPGPCTAVSTSTRVKARSLRVNTVVMSAWAALPIDVTTPIRSGTGCNGHRALAVRSPSSDSFAISASRSAASWPRVKVGSIADMRSWSRPWGG